MPLTSGSPRIGGLRSEESSNADSNGVGSSSDGSSIEIRDSDMIGVEPPDNDHLGIMLPSSAALVNGARPGENELSSDYGLPNVKIEDVIASIFHQRTSMSKLVRSFPGPHQMYWRSRKGRLDLTASQHFKFWRLAIFPSRAALLIRTCSCIATNKPAESMNLFRKSHIHWS